MALKKNASSSAVPHQCVPGNFAFRAEQILFEDEWLVAVNKSAGLPTQPTLDASRPNVFNLLKEFLEKRDGAECYLGMHHRLDRDTSGVVLFTKKAEANAGVAALFSQRDAQKTYLAISVAGAQPTEIWEVKNYLGVVGKVGKSQKFGSVRSGGDPAHTTFRLRERFAGAVLIEAQPHTGRTHQIRVHLAEGGYPICGDALYGGPAELANQRGQRLRFPRLMLHARALAFPHPFTRAAVEIHCPLPEDFERCLASLRDAT